MIMERAQYMKDRYQHLKAELGGASPMTFWRALNPAAAKAHRDQEKERWHTDPATRLRHRSAIVRNNDKLKTAAYAAYGGFVCKCCGETTKAFLTLDHINNDGAAHRETFTYGSGALYRWLRNHGCPEGFQVLCMNCNFGKRMNGGVCPHQQQPAEAAS